MNADMDHDWDLPSVQTPDEEAERERRWWEFELEVRNFAASEPEGYAAVLRAVSRAMKEQMELIRR